MAIDKAHAEASLYFDRVVNHGQRGDGYRARVLTFGSVNERGWGWTASEICRVQLLACIAEQSAEHPERYVDIKAFYDVRSDQDENAIRVASGDLAFLAEERLIMDGSGIGGIESMAAMLAPQGHDFLGQLQARRADKIQRRTACRDAMVAWLYAAAAMDAVRRVDRAAMLRDTRHGMWLAVPFAPDDLYSAHAAVSLRRGKFQSPPARRIIVGRTGVAPAREACQGTPGDCTPALSGSRPGV